MNNFSSAAVHLISRHGMDVQYVTTVEGAYDPETGSVSNTTASKTVKAYPKTIKTNAYNFPDLINKTVVEWIIPSTMMASVPEPQDTIRDGSNIYSVYRVFTIIAHGEDTVYRIISIKG